MLRYLLLALLLYGWLGCTPASTPATPLSPFFDLTAFFEAETARLATLGPVTKRTIINGVAESKTVSGLDYRAELGPFISADINRPAWLDKYRVDSLTRDGQLQKLTYTALDDDLFTRRVVIAFDNATVDSIYIEKASSLMIADTRRTLVYQPASGYSIRGAQQVLLASDNSIGIEVAF